MRPPALRKFVPATNLTTTCHSVDRNDLEALDGLCLEWRVDLEPIICAQEAIKAMRVASCAQMSSLPQSFPDLWAAMAWRRESLPH